MKILYIIIQVNRHNVLIRGIRKSSYLERTWTGFTERERFFVRCPYQTCMDLSLSKNSYWQYLFTNLAFPEIKSLQLRFPARWGKPPTALRQFVVSLSRSYLTGGSVTMYQMTWCYTAGYWGHLTWQHVISSFGSL